MKLTIEERTEILNCVSDNCMVYVKVDGDNIVLVGGLCDSVLAEEEKCE